MSSTLVLLTLLISLSVAVVFPNYNFQEITIKNLLMNMNLWLVNKEKGLLY